jgi:DNA polymerase-1
MARGILKNPKPFVKPEALRNWTGPTLLLMDGTYFLFRAYHALPPLSTRAGVPTHAVYGFTTMLLKALREVLPTHAAVAFDLGGSDARSALAPAYKANRSEPPGDLVPQFGLARRVVEALGLPLLEKRGTEADDILATLARKAERESFFTVLLAGDKDFMQIVDPHTVLLDTMYERWVGPQQVLEKTGVRPDQIVEYMALLGDSIDNIAGIPGVGPKTASQLIAQFGTAEALLERLDEVPKDKLRDKLREHAPNIRLARRLVELELDVPLPVSLDDLVRKEPDPAPLRKLFEELEFTRIVRDLPPPGAPIDGRPPPPTEKLPLAFVPAEVVTSTEAASATFGWLARQDKLAIVAELSGAGDRPKALVGVGLAAGAADAVRSFYVPIAHEVLGGQATAEARTALAALLATPELPKIGFGLKDAATALHVAGFPVANLDFDGELALYLVDPGRREHALVDVVPQRFDAVLPKVDLPAPTRRKLSLGELAPGKLAPHAAASAQAALALEPILSADLRAQGLWALFRELEMPLLPVLAEMEWGGVKVDVAVLDALARQVDAQILELCERIYALAGGAFNIASSRQLAEVLFKKLGLPILRRTKTGPSTDQDVLEKLALQHALPAAVLEERQLSKLKGTYLDALPLLVDPRDGRVHTTFNQATAATGRLSSSDPNLQNIPTRTEVGKRIRAAFVAEPGKVLVSADYNQVELRILAHMSGDPVLCDQFARDVDIHTLTAAEVFALPVSEVTKQMRSAAKAINFGIAYGLSAFGLAQRLELPPREAQKIIDAYFARYRGVRDWLDATIDGARREGFVSTLFGRRRLLPDIYSKNTVVRQGAERMAVNTPIQGTAADLIKRAMLRADTALRAQQLPARMTLQVHDELVFEVAQSHADQVATLAKDAMAGAGELRVPLVVTVGIDRSWAEAH